MKVELKTGDFLLCRKNYIIRIPNKNVDRVIWKFGKKYKIIGKYEYTFRGMPYDYQYNIETEEGEDLHSIETLEDYFLFGKKERKFKIYRLNKIDGTK